MILRLLSLLRWHVTHCAQCLYWPQIHAYGKGHWFFDECQPPVQRKGWTHPAHFAGKIRGAWQKVEEFEEI